MSHSVDYWYKLEAKAEGRKLKADASWSDIDCVYRGNIYDNNGKIIGDYTSSDWEWINRHFDVRWK